MPSGQALGLLLGRAREPQRRQRSRQSPTGDHDVAPRARRTEGCNGAASLQPPSETQSGCDLVGRSQPTVRVRRGAAHWDWAHDDRSFAPAGASPFVRRLTGLSGMRRSFAVQLQHVGHRGRRRQPGASTVRRCGIGLRWRAVARQLGSGCGAASARLRGIGELGAVGGDHERHPRRVGDRRVRVGGRTPGRGSRTRRWRCGVDVRARDQISGG